jgi:hypothetical protein
MQVAKYMHLLTKVQNGNFAAFSRSALFLGLGLGVTGGPAHNRHYKDTYAPSIAPVSPRTFITRESHLFSLNTGQVDNMAMIAFSWTGHADGGRPETPVTIFFTL